MITRKYHIFLLSALLALILWGCGSGRKATKKPGGKLPAPKEFLKNYTAKQPDLQTVDMSKVSMSIRIGDKSFSTKGFIRLIQDSVIVISAQPFAGIELFRAYITPGEVTVLDRTKSQYYKGSTGLMKEMTGLDFDFEIMQALFCNYLFTTQTGNAQPDKDMFSFQKYENGYELSASETYDMSFVINKQLQLEKTTITDKTSPYSLTCDYADFTVTDAIDFPKSVKFTVFDGQKPQGIEIKVNKVSFNTPVNATLAIPAKYKEMSIDNLDF